jgi:hypothetical protein
MFLIFLTGCQQTTTSTITTEKINYLTTETTTTQVPTTRPQTTTEIPTTQTTITYEIDPLREEVVEKMRIYSLDLKGMDKFTYYSDMNYLICFNDDPNSIYSEDFMRSTVKIDTLQGYMFNEFANSVVDDLNTKQYISIQEDKLVLNRRVTGGFTQEIISTDLSSENVKNIIQSTFDLDLYFSYFLPEYAIITKFSEDFYRLRFTIDEFLYFDPFIAQALGFYNKFYEDDVVNVYIDIKFNEDDFEYKLSHDSYAIGMQHSSAIYYLDMTIVENYYGNTIDEYNYPDRTTSFYLFDDPLDCLYTYQADIRFGVSMVMDAVGYFKIYLEAGYYTLDHDFNQYGQAFTFYDEAMNEVSIGSSFKIETSGIYYGKITHGYDNYFSTTFKFNFIDFSQENIIYLPESHLIGTLDKFEKMSYFIMAESAEAKIVKLTYNDYNTGTIDIRSYGDFQRLGIEGATYLYVQPGDFLIIDVIGLFDGSDYDLNWEFVDVNFTSTSSVTAPTLNIGQNNVLIVPGSDTFGLVQFTVTEPGNYIFDFYQPLNETSNILTFEIYDSEFNLIIESIGNESLDLENGTYYIKVVLSEEIDSIFDIYYFKLE